MEERPVLIEKEQGVAWLTLNRPKAYNSLSTELMEELIAALVDCEKDPETKVVVLKGAGKGFCAGGDLSKLDSLRNVKDSREYIALAGKVSSTIYNLAKPVIAMVTGAAAGAGFNIVLACDLVFCSTDARFIQSFATIGLIPDGGGCYFLPRLVGLQKAKELMFLATPLDAQKAMELGIVNQVAEKEKLLELVSEYALKLSKCAPMAVMLTKKTLNQSYLLSLEEVLDAEADRQTICLGTADNKEGIAAFKEKREPVFRGI